KQIAVAAQQIYSSKKTFLLFHFHAQQCTLRFSATDFSETIPASTNGNIYGSRPTLHLRPDHREEQAHLHSLLLHTLYIVQAGSLLQWVLPDCASFVPSVQEFPVH